MPCFYAIIAVITFTSGTTINPLFILFLVPLPYWLYVIFHTKKVYYKEGELYISGLFLNNLKLLRRISLAALTGQVCG